MRSWTENHAPLYIMSIVSLVYTSLLLILFMNDTKTKSCGGLTGDFSFRTSTYSSKISGEFTLQMRRLWAPQQAVV